MEINNEIGRDQMSLFDIVFKTASERVTAGDIVSGKTFYADGLIPDGELVEKRCLHCGAPLHGLTCEYCGTEYEVKVKHEVKVKQQKIWNPEARFGVKMIPIC